MLHVNIIHYAKAATNCNTNTRTWYGYFGDRWAFCHISLCMRRNSYFPSSGQNSGIAKIRHYIHSTTQIFKKKAI